ncbi:MAG: hypothetical protein Q4F53_00280 [Nesterenkonia sp.]|nr:hypothetical protein [Nesterenkonia sp.]
MSSETDPAERGAVLQARRQARALDDPEAALPRFLDEAEERLRIDWSRPNEFPRGQRQVQMMITGAQRNRARAPKLAPGLWAVLRGGSVIGSFDARMSSMPSAMGVGVTRSRPLTHAYLTHSAVPTPRSRGFDVEDVDSAASFAVELGTVAVKPGTGRGGRGVSWGVGLDSGRDDFDAAFAYAASRIWRRPAYCPQVVVQEHREGLDLRLLVVAEEVVGAVARVPLHVVGDGTSTLGRLAEQAAARRRSNQLLARFPVEVGAEELRRLGTDPESVPALGRREVVSAIGNPFSGGISVDVTDLIAEDLKALAVDAVWSLPDVKVAGVDLIAPSPDSAEGAVVTEFREDPVLGLHGFPLYGRSRSTATPLIEAMITRARD